MRDGMTSRSDFDIAVGIFGKAFKNKQSGMPMGRDQVLEQFRPTQSRIRLEQACSTTTTLVTFPIIANNNQGTPFNTEVRLNQQDTFIPTHVRYGLGNPSGTTDATFKTFTYLDPFIFQAANTAPMQVFYNGVLKIMVNNVQYINNWPLDWHQDIRTTQQTAAVGPASPVDEYDGATSGKISMQPFVLLIGSQNIVIQAQFPVAPSAVLANSRHIIEFDGILFQNSTVVS